MSNFMINFLAGAAFFYIQKTYNDHRLNCEVEYEPKFSNDTVKKLLSCEEFIEYCELYKKY